MAKTAKHKDIQIPPNRQRKEKSPTYIVDLANSIEKNGLFHPPVIRGDGTSLLLVAGECRLEAIDYLWNMGGKLRYGGQEFPEGTIPVNFLGELDPVDAFEAELEENIRRTDLTWQERADATAKLFQLRELQAQRDSRPAPTVASVAAEIRGSSGSAQESTRKELVVARHLGDEDVAKAKTIDEAFKVLKRKEELKQSAELAKAVGKNFSCSDHQLLRGDCLAILPTLMPESFDVILTDPPYGINAQEFNDSGKLVSGTHFYDDTPAAFKAFAPLWLEHCFRVAKPEAHLYWFCDIMWFEDLKLWAAMAGWRTFRTPLIWVNPKGMRAPWPEHGPQRKWQAILYATKGDKKVLKLAPDVLTFPSDDNLNHHAQKPVALYRELLGRSARPGDSCIDPFCGSGTIFAAAHTEKVKAVGIELDEAAAGISAQRLKELK